MNATGLCLCCQEQLVSLLAERPEVMAPASSLGGNFLSELWLRVNKKPHGSNTQLIFVQTTARI